MKYYKNIPDRYFYDLRDKYKKTFVDQHNGSIAFIYKGHNHNEKGPALIEYNNANTRIVYKHFYLNGNLIQTNKLSNKEWRKYIKLLVFL